MVVFVGVGGGGHGGITGSGGGLGGATTAGVTLLSPSEVEVADFEARRRVRLRFILPTSAGISP